MAVLGERFRAAREARGLSLSEVSEQIRIRSVYLAAIEEERWAAIGAPVYVRGFLRTYARFLGLDPEEVVAAFNAEVAPAGQASETAAPAGRGGSGRWAGPWMVWVASLVAVALVAYVVFNALTMRREPEPVAAVTAAAATAGPTSVPATPSPASSGQPSAGPSASPGAPSPGAQAGSHALALVLSQPAWLRVVVDGNVSMEGTFPAGTSKTFHGRTALLRLGNAGGVDVYVDGKNVGKLGKPGDVVERSFTL